MLVLTAWLVSITMDESTTSVKIEKLNDTNFHIWKQKIQLQLALRDLDQYIDSTPPTEEKELATWTRGDRKAKAIIGLSLSDEHLNHVRDVSSAKEMWTAIRNLFERHTLLNKLAARRRFYTATMQEGEKVLTFINRIQQLASTLKSMGIDVDEKEVAMAVLNGLPPQYENLIVALDALGNEDKLFTLEYVKSRLLQEDERASMRNSDTPNTASSALLSYGNRSNTKHNTQNKDMLCSNCGHTGHTAPRCWGRDVNGRRPPPPPGYVPKGTNRPERSGGTGFVTTEIDVPSSSSVISATDFTCLMTKLVNAGTPARSSSWIIDSGCSAHITFDRSRFTTYIPETLRTVEMGDKGTANVAGRGDVMIQVLVNGAVSHCKLTNVLHVPNFEYSLVSVSKMDSRGLCTSFQNGVCTITAGEKLIATGSLKNSLYTLNTVRTSPAIIDNANIAKVQPLQLWHERMAHVHKRGITSMVSRKVVRGINDIPSSPSSACDSDSDLCRACVLGKAKRAPFQKATEYKKASSALELVHSDLCGPMEVPSLGGSRYFITFIDDHSNWVTTYTMQRKSESFDKFKLFQAYAERKTGRKIKCLRTDRGGEYLSNAFSSHLGQSGVRRNLTAPYTPQQNGVAERMNRTLIELVRSMLSHKNMGKEFWAEALATAVFVRNRVTSRALPSDKTPHHMWHGCSPNLAFLRVFGSRCWYKLPNALVKKLDNRSEEAIMIGYAQESKAYKLWDQTKSRIVVSRDVVFDEQFLSNKVIRSSSSSTGNSSDTIVLLDYNANQTDNGNSSQAAPSNIETPSNLSLQTPEPIEESASNGNAPAEQSSPVQPSPSPSIQTNTPDDSNMFNLQSPAIEDPNPDDPDGTNTGLRRSTRIRTQPSTWWKAFVTTENVDSEHPITPLNVPITYRAATTGPYASFWQTGIDAEIDSLRRNSTWELVPRSQATNVLTSKWVFKVKDIPGSGNQLMQKAKARLVARGFQQVQGVDYSETYAPVVKFTSIRALLATVAAHDLELHQMDVVTAFLNGDVDEDIYMEQPSGCVDPSKPEHVCKLNKALYGLKQSPRQWYFKIHSYLTELGYISSPNDPCLYVKKTETEFIALALYVDDLLLAGSSVERIQQLKLELHKRFEMKDLGEAKVCLGLEIHRNRSERKLWLAQSKYANTVLARFGMDTCKPVHTPMDANAQLQKADGGAPVTDEPYRQAIGSLMYLMVGTRPDLAFSVGKLSQFVEAPTDTHWIAVKRILRYVAGTANMCIQYSGKLDNKVTNLIGYSDSDWAGDHSDRKSTSTFVFTFCGGAISWCSRKQTIVAASTCEAEYIGLTMASKEAIWLRRLVGDILGPRITENPLVVWSDNNGAISLTTNEALNRRNKHIDIAYHFVRDAVRRGVVKIVYLPTTEMAADILTKPVGRVILDRLRSSLGLVNQGEHQPR